MITLEAVAYWKAQQRLREDGQGRDKGKALHLFLSLCRLFVQAPSMNGKGTRC